MHLYILTRGIKHLVDNFIKQLEGQYFPMQYPNPTTQKLETHFVQLAVRPIQLWEIVFPEEHKDIIMTTIIGADKGKPQHKKHSKFIYLLRKVLGIKPVPDYKTDKIFPIAQDHVERTAIGVKSDYYVTLSGAKLFNPTEEQKKECWEGL